MSGCESLSRLEREGKEGGGGGTEEEEVICLLGNGEACSDLGGPTLQCAQYSSHICTQPVLIIISTMREHSMIPCKLVLTILNWYQIHTRA